MMTKKQKAFIVVEYKAGTCSIQSVHATADAAEKRKTRLERSNRPNPCHTFHVIRKSIQGTSVSEVRMDKIESLIVVYDNNQ